MSNVSLTSVMSSNLLTLKQTASLLSMTQNRLATGLKVNSAIDNPSSYYAAVSLNNRASDLNMLLDGMGQAIQTVKAAVEGVETATAFLEQMQSIAEQAIAEPIALQTTPPSSSDTSSILQTRPLEEFEGYTQITSDMSAADIQALITEGAKLVLADDISLGSSLMINVNNVTIEGNGHKLIDDNLDHEPLLFIRGSNININNFSFDYSSSDAIVQISSANNVKMSNFEINATQEWGCLGLSVYNSTVEMSNFKMSCIGNDSKGVLAQNSTVKMNNFELNIIGNRNTGIASFNSSSVEMSNFELNAEGFMTKGIETWRNGTVTLDSEAGINVSGEDAEIFDSSYGGQITEDSSLSAAWSESVNDSESESPTDDETGSVIEKIGVGSEWSKAFNDVLNQYDMLIDDASYKGINLLKGERLDVAFNEDKSGHLNISGRDISSSALGLSNAEWQTVDEVSGAISNVQRSIATLRSLSGELGNNYSIVQSRQDFTESLINILTEGADKLTLADMNEESAIMLALQTRQQLAINSLSLASQSAQSVLNLFV